MARFKHVKYTDSEVQSQMIILKELSWGRRDRAFPQTSLISMLRTLISRIILGHPNHDVLPMPMKWSAFPLFIALPYTGKAAKLKLFNAIRESTCIHNASNLWGIYEDAHTLKN